MQFHLRSTIFAIAIVPSALLSAPANAELKREFHSGNWIAGVYSNDQTKKFSHCSAWIGYQSNITLFVSVTNSYSWNLGFLNNTWALEPGIAIPLIVSFGGDQPYTGNGSAKDAHFVILPMSGDSKLIKDFKGGALMTITAGSTVHKFALNGTSRLFADLAFCVSTELARERGQPLPQPVATAPTVPKSKPLNPAPSISSLPQKLEADTELVATRIATNLLLQAKMNNARLLSSAETPAFLKGRGVAWKSDGGVGSVELLPASAGNDALKVASNTISHDAASCLGDFASGRSSDLIDNMIVTKAFTGCKDSDGSRTVKYFIFHREGSGYVVYSLGSGSGVADPQSDTPQREANFQAAAVKASFAP